MSNGSQTFDRPPASLWLVTVAVVASAFALYFGRELLVPIAFALLLNALLRPAVRGLKKVVRLPAPAGAAIVTLAAFALIGISLYLLAAPAQRWLTTVPDRLNRAHTKIERLRRPMRQMSEVAEKIQSSAGGATTLPTTVPAHSTPAPAPQMPPSTVIRAFGTTAHLIMGIVSVLLLLYLLLASDDLFVRKLIKVMPSARDKEAAARVADESQRVVTRYLLTAATIYAGQGIIVGVAMWLLGMPNPLIWALLTLALEFIPYFGALVVIATIALVALTTFDPMWRVLAPPLTYLVVTTIQASVVSPITYGNRLRLNPVAVLIGVLLWWFLWGVPGAFLAVPIIATVKVICDRVEGCKALGEFLGE